MGAGYHGGFGHTFGERNKICTISKPILKRGDVRYSVTKTQGYLLYCKPDAKLKVIN